MFYRPPFKVKSEAVHADTASRRSKQEILEKLKTEEGRQVSLNDFILIQYHLGRKHFILHLHFFFMIFSKSQQDQSLFSVRD